MHQGNTSISYLWWVGQRGKWVMGMEEGTCWDEHWVLYGNQFDNKLYLIKKKFLKQTTFLFFLKSIFIYFQ